MIELRRYQLEDASTPATEWLRGLRDARARAQIEVRLRRLSVGNFGDHKSGQALVILLCGGDKGSQQSHIMRAKAYWID